MIQFKQLPFEETSQIVTSFVARRLPFNNYFLNDLNGMMCYQTRDTLILKKEYEGFNRIYYISNSSDELSSLLTELTENDAINIPTKRDLSHELVNVLEKGGYKLFSTYERLYKNTNERRGEFEASYAKDEDFADIRDLLVNQLFSPISDRFPTELELKKMISNKQILVNRNEEGRVNGLLIFSIENKRCDFLEWASLASIGESLFLYLNAFNLMGKLGIEKSTIWVRCDNIRPKKIYFAWGYQPDGLKDYTFLK